MSERERFQRTETKRLYEEVPSAVMAVMAAGKATGYEHAYEILLSFLRSLADTADERGYLQTNCLALSVTISEAEEYLSECGLPGKWLSIRESKHTKHSVPPG